MIEFINRIWGGKEKLWKVFWIWNFLIFNIFDVLAVLIFFVAIFPVHVHWAAQNDPSISVAYPLTFLDAFYAFLGFCFILLMLAYTVWILVALWRSAFNSSKRIYGYLARSWVIIQLCYAIVFPIGVCQASCPILIKKIFIPFFLYQVINNKFKLLNFLELFIMSFPLSPVAYATGERGNDIKV